MDMTVQGLSPAALGERRENLPVDGGAGGKSWDAVDEANSDFFPASDPPAWTGTKARPVRREAG